MTFTLLPFPQVRILVIMLGPSGKHSTLSHHKILYPTDRIPPVRDDDSHRLWRAGRGMDLSGRCYHLCSLHTSSTCSGHERKTRILFYLFNFFHSVERRNKATKTQVTKATSVPTRLQLDSRISLLIKDSHHKPSGCPIAAGEMAPVGCFRLL